LDTTWNIIDNPKELKKLSIEELPLLAQEIRENIIKTVSNNGGHLASNLGVVELTLALHYVFDTPKDKIIWDVGHQCYAHKMITGRGDRFDSLRRYKGISGFPKREESPYDTFNTGHSSTSLSAALGMAVSRDLKKEDYKVVAVIGDGALTGGMAFEALNNAGRYEKNLIYILNDNEMSISKNVGGLSKYLSRIRTAQSYIRADKRVKSWTVKIPLLGKPIVRFIRKVKNALKMAVLPGMLFENIGFKYIGPIDGHNIREMVHTFKSVKEINAPVIVHVATKKGKGYSFAEEYPDDFHSVAPFDIATGTVKSKTDKKKYSDIFADEVIRLAEKNPSIVTVSAAMAKGTGLDRFEKRFPERFFDVGIAEQHAVTFAAGMAAEGLVPVVAIYSTFLQRAYDQVLHDVALQNLHVIFAIDRAGLAEGDGETHHGIYDVSFLMHIPNIMIMAAADYNDLEHMLRYAVTQAKGPVAIRYPRCEGNRLPENDCEVIKGCGVIQGEGQDVCLIAVDGLFEEAGKIYRHLSEAGIKGKVLNPRFLKPLDREFYETKVMDSKMIVFMEETIEEGSYSQSATVQLLKWGYKGKIMSFSLENVIIPAGPRDTIIREYGWKTERIIEAVQKEIFG
jgi:1-deoxy-D-xylulose-5-phosphate synthase